MRTSAIALLLGASALSAVVVRSQVVDSLKDALADCTTCLQTGGDGDCTDECDVIGNADNAVNSCCSWWSCSTCDEAPAVTTQSSRKTTTTRPARDRVTTTRASRNTDAASTAEATAEKKTDATRQTEATTQATTQQKTDAPNTDKKTDAPKTDSLKTDAPTTEAVKTTEKTTDAPTEKKTDAPKTDAPKTEAPTTTTEGSFNPNVATVYEESDCGGKSVTLTVSDFVGGADNTAWDACNAQWADGTTIEYQGGTWLKSMVVFPGFSVSTATQCNDDYTYDSIAWQQVVSAADGCQSMDYDFNHLDYSITDHSAGGTGTGTGGGHGGGIGPGSGSGGHGGGGGIIS